MQAGRLHHKRLYVSMKEIGNCDIQFICFLGLSESSSGKRVARLVYWCYGADIDCLNDLSESMPWFV